MNASTRRRMLGTGLLLTLAATGWVASQDEPQKPAGAERNSRTAMRSERRAPQAQSEAAAELHLEQLKRPEFSDNSGQLFPSQTWQPPPAAASSQPPEAPRAPPLQFSYFGRMVEGGKTVVFLSQGNRDYAVKQGETILGTYRIDEIGKDALVMTYLPLEQQQTLMIEAAK